MKVSARHYAVCEVGAREQNQDAYVAQDPVFGVFDGMGGHPLGDVASRIAADHFGAMSRLPGRQFREARGAAIREMLSREGFQPNARSMGTTAAVLHLGYRQVAWAGDSRVYLLRDGALRRETTDHNTGHGLTNYLGQGATLPMEIRAIQPQAGDRYYLVTDGVYVLEDDEIEAVVSRRPLGEGVSRLAELVAKHPDLRDNFTILGVEVLPGPPPRDPEPSASAPP